MAANDKSIATERVTGSGRLNKRKVHPTLQIIRTIIKQLGRRLCDRVVRHIGVSVRRCVQPAGDDSGKGLGVNHEMPRLLVGVAEL